MCPGVLLGTYFWYDLVSSCIQGSLLDGQGLESAYLQQNCFGLATVGKNIHQSWTPQNNCDWNCLAHSLDLHEVGALWGFCNCSCDVPESSLGSINWKSDHICCRLCTGTSSQGIGIPMHEWNHHIYYNGWASYAFFYCHKVSLPDLMLSFQEPGDVFCLPVGLLFLLCLFVGSSVCRYLIKLI